MRKTTLLSVVFTLLLSACAGSPSLMARSTALPVGTDGTRVLGDAAQVLGQPDRQWNILDDDKKETGVAIVTFKVKGQEDLALYFYKGTFIELESMNTLTGFPSIRADYKDIAHRTAGPDVYILEKRDGKTIVTPLQKKRQL